ncbi:MAG: hypothetical protein R3204_11230 [Oceanospirillum sp.]|nr:hypothetical protein [Oceanospirillum sp.]MDX1399089.1 hypothetical protein [Oceanospirillum sp.]
MRFNELVHNWKSKDTGAITEELYSIRLPVEDAARLQALAELFPRRPAELLLADLIKVALDEVEGRFPYEKGTKVVAHDEEGDPIYEDEGLTPRFLELSRHYLKEYTKLKKAG